MQSHLDCSPSDSNAYFHGQLDQTLDGAGFASQRTTGDHRSWDLSDYDGIQIGIREADKKRYTFIIKDELLPRNPENGREQSTISYEYGFSIPCEMANSNGTFIFIPWRDFKVSTEIGFAYHPAAYHPITHPPFVARAYLMYI